MCISLSSLIFFHYSDISDCIRNLHVEVKNNTRKTQKMKVHFDNENSNCSTDFKIKICNKQAGPRLMHGDLGTGLSNGMQIRIKNDFYDAEDKRKAKGSLREKPLDLPEFEKPQSQRIVVSPEYNKSRLDIQDYEKELNHKAQVLLKMTRIH